MQGPRAESTDRVQAFGFMGGTGPADAFDFVGDEITKNKKSI